MDCNRKKETIDQIVERINTNLISSAKNTFGAYFKKSMNENSCKVNNVESKEWFTQECAIKRTRYHEARKQYNISKSPDNYNTLQQTSRDYKRTLDKAIFDQKKIIGEKLKQTKSDNPREFWKIINNNNNVTSSVNATPDSLFEHFRNVCYLEEIRSLPDTVFDTSASPDNELNAPITSDDIRKAILKLKNGKACGDDDISNEYLKTSCDLLIPTYVKLFNVLMKTSVYPSNWATGTIIPIFKKKGDPCNPGNYRPITLSSCMGKVFSSVLNQRLTTYIENNKILKQNQGAFMPGTSTTSHMFNLHCLLEMSKSNKDTLFCAFMDLSGAFDNVWRDGMFMKILENGLGGNFFNIIKSMYKETKSYIRCENLNSDSFICNTGIKQGCNLSCLLFALYLNDLEDFMNDNNCVGVDIPDLNSGSLLLKMLLLLYADDTVIFSRTYSDMKNSLSIFSAYCKKWKLKINEEKSKMVIFVFVRPYYTFTLNGKTIEKEKTYKYLGLNFSKNVRYFEAIRYNVCQARKAAFSISKKSRELNLSPSCEIHLINSVVKPILLYGCEIYCIEKTAIIEQFYEQCLKRILKVNKSTPSYMIYGETGCMPISTDITKRALSFYLKTKTSPSHNLSKQLLDIITQRHFNTDYTSRYITYIETSLNTLGLTYLLHQGTNVNITLNQTKHIISTRVND